MTRAPHSGWVVSAQRQLEGKAWQPQDDGIILSAFPLFPPDPVHTAGTLRMWKNRQAWVRKPQRRQEVLCALSWPTKSQFPIWFSWIRTREQWRRRLVQHMWVSSVDPNILQPKSLSTWSESERPLNPSLLRAHLPLFVHWIRIIKMPHREFFLNKELWWCYI